METWIKHNNSLNERWLMPTQLIKVDVEKVSPQAYYNAHKNELDIIPDGVGLQILINCVGISHLSLKSYCVLSVFP